MKGEGKGKEKEGERKEGRNFTSTFKPNKIFIFPIIIQPTRHPESSISWWHHHSPCCSGYMSQNHFYFTFHLFCLVDYQKLSSLPLKHISNYPLSSSPLLSNLVTAFMMLHLKPIWASWMVPASGLFSCQYSNSKIEMWYNFSFKIFSGSSLTKTFFVMAFRALY